MHALAPAIDGVAKPPSVLFEPQVFVPWLDARCFLVAARKGASSMQLAKETGITRKSAWFVLQRLREACANNLSQLNGAVEIDES